MSGSRLPTDMAYEDFALLVVHMDGEADFRRPRDDKNPRDSFFKTADAFARECRKYREGMVRNWNAFNGHPERTDDPYSQFLYRPVSFVTFGDTDCISAVAIDDFHPTAWLAASTIPMRQTCLAFCPKLGSLGLDTIRVDPDDPDAEPVFCSAQELFPPQGVSHDPPRAVLSPDRSLVALSYFKLNSMAIIGPGVLFEEAVFRAMGRTIVQTLRTLRDYARQANGTLKPLFSEDDVGSFRCVLLDPQGWSDISTLMFARNYTVTMSVMEALRQLTFKQLYETGDGRTLLEAVECFGVHRQVADEATQIAQSHQDFVEMNPTLSKNHVFCSTYPTLGVTEEAFRTGGQTAHGYVAASTEVEVDPGHLAIARKIARVKALQMQPAGDLRERPFFWCTIGQGDASLPHLVSDGPGPDLPVEIGSLLRVIISARDCDGDGLGGPLYSHVLGMSTNLRIPILLSDVSNGKNDHMDMRSVLSMLQDTLFREKGSPLELDLLRRSLRQIRISAPLSQTVVDLFAEYANCLADPFLHERVLDLFDIFCATYELLAKELPQKLRERLATNAQSAGATADCLCHTFLQDEDIRDLVELVALLQNALTHRKRPAFRNVKRWGTSLDVRLGNVDKLVNAADSPLKCGLGVVRRIMNGWTEAHRPVTKRLDRENARRIGGASLISCDLRSLSHQLCIGPVDDIFLASVNLSTVHLTRPSAFCIHLHETAHLVCDLLRSSQCTVDGDTRRHEICYRDRGGKTKEAERIILERHQDIFSEILVHHFVFEEDSRTYFRNYLANYSLDPIAYCADKEDSFRRMFEVLVRGFLATEPFRAQHEDPELYKLANRDTAPPEKIPDVYAKFKEAVGDAGPFFIGFRHLWREDHPEFDPRVAGLFRKVYDSTYAPLCCMWADATKIFKGVTQDNQAENVFGTDIADQRELREVVAGIRTSLQQGRPLARVKFKVRGRKSRGEEARLDPFLLVRLLLREHITSLFGPPQGTTSTTRDATQGVDTATTQVCLIRRADNGEPCPEALPPGMKWHTQLIDRNCNGLFSVDPSVRRNYMKQRIAIVKTLWDISTNLRARRLDRILQMVREQRNQGKKSR